MDVYYSVTDATVSALCTAAVLVVVCVAAMCVLVVPGRRDEHRGPHGGPGRRSPAISVECPKCRVRCRCTGPHRTAVVNCPRCGTELVSSTNEPRNAASGDPGGVPTVRGRVDPRSAITRVNTA
ncbi:unnamed protein product [Gemmata massiliana]|uniref:Uncharacterized protein n=1 Tax=Gemmata massiliana TaxID=1210884 RepID=A0A6P2D038_9BACT|nr:unnamed protein product [Gemmata massiliana]